MVANLSSNIRVGVINVSVGGCQIELFDKYNYQSYLATAPDWLKGTANEYGGNPYQWLVDLAKLAQKSGVIKGILLHQGESNYGDSQWPSKVKGVYNNLISDLGLNPASVPLLAGQLAGGDNSGMNSSIIATLPQVISNSYITSSNNLATESDNIHFTSASIRELGTRYATKMLSLLGSCSPTTITPYMQVSGGTWQQTSSVAVNSGTQVVLGPQPTSGGSWSWSGGGTSGTSREQTITPTTTVTATATYSNSCGAKSTQTFTINVNGSSSGQNVRLTKSNATGFSIDGNNGGANGQQIYLWASDASNVNQTWVEIDRGGGYYSYQKLNTNYCMDGGNGGANGQSVYLWTCDANNQNQQWQKISAGSNFRLQKRNASGYSIDGGNGGANGQNLYLWASDANNQNQQWIFTASSLKSAKLPVADNAASSPAFEIYPNPSSDGNFKVNLSGSDGEIFSVAIYSVDGKKVYETKNLSQGTNEINSGLKKGVYYIQLHGSKAKIGINKLVID
jgi:hypothetical protein